MLGACSKDDFLAKVESWATAACICKDQACADKQQEAFKKLRKEAREANYKPSEADEDKLDKFPDQGKDCLGKLRKNK